MGKEINVTHGYGKNKKKYVRGNQSSHWLSNWFTTMLK